MIFLIVIGNVLMINPRQLITIMNMKDNDQVIPFGIMMQMPFWTGFVGLCEQPFMTNRLSLSFFDWSP